MREEREREREIERERERDGKKEEAHACDPKGSADFEKKKRLKTGHIQICMACTPGTIPSHKTSKTQKP